MRFGWILGYPLALALLAACAGGGQGAAPSADAAVVIDGWKLSYRDSGFVSAVVDQGTADLGGSSADVATGPGDATLADTAVDTLPDAACWGEDCVPCEIQGTSYEPGEGHPDPSQPCLACRPLETKFEWSDRVDGVACKAAGNVAGICVAGECETNKCLVAEGRAVAHGTLDSSSRCQRCDVSTTRKGWTSVPAGVDCQLGTRGGVCDADGVCQTTGCVIDGVLMQEGAVSPTGPAAGCAVCESEASRKGWSRLSVGALCLDETGICREEGQCFVPPAPTGASSEWQEYPAGGGEGVIEIPKDVYRMEVEAWGGGGAGGSHELAEGEALRGGAGGGGAYVASQLLVLSGQEYGFVVGGGGLPTGTGGEPGGGEGRGKYGLTSVGGGGGGYTALYGHGRLVVAGGGGGGGGPQMRSPLAAGRDGEGGRAKSLSDGKAFGTCDAKATTTLGGCGLDWREPQGLGFGGYGARSQYGCDSGGGGGGGAGWGGGAGGRVSNINCTAYGFGGKGGGSTGLTTRAGQGRQAGNPGPTGYEAVGKGGAPAEAGQPGHLRIRYLY